MFKLTKYIKLESLPFPYGKPQWPNTVERTPPKYALGARFETDWSRSPAIRAIRSIITDFFTKPAINILAKPTIMGTDRILEVPTPAIFAANHASHIDTPLLLTSLPDRYRHKTAVGAGADYFFNKRYKGYIWSFLLAAIPIERIKVSRRTNDLAKKVLSDGWSLILFPEGGRSPDGFAREFKGGAAQLSIKTQRPVIPVYIGGTYEIFGKHKTLPQKGKTVVNFGYPISPSTTDPRQFAKTIEAEVTRLADEVFSDYWSAAKNQGSHITPSLRSTDNESWIQDWNRPRYKNITQSREKAWLTLPLMKKKFE